MEPKGVILCDLDGTLASCEWRRHFVEPKPPDRHKDWASFFNGIPFDSVVPSVKRMLEDFEEDGYQIIYVSARPDNKRRQTVDWLTKHSCPGGPPFELYMRKSSDSRHDPEVKQDILNNQLGKYFRAGLIHKVIDDRPQVIEMWKRNGLDVHEVSDPGLEPAILSIAALLEEAAMRITAGMRESNLIQFLLSQEMGQDFIDWAQEYGDKFRKIYNENQEIKQQIDNKNIQPVLIEQLVQLLSVS